MATKPPTRKSGRVGLNWNKLLKHMGAGRPGHSHRIHRFLDNYPPINLVGHWQVPYNNLLPLLLTPPKRSQICVNPLLNNDF